MAKETRVGRITAAATKQTPSTPLWGFTQAHIFSTTPYLRAVGRAGRLSHHFHFQRNATQRKRATELRPQAGPPSLLFGAANSASAFFSATNPLPWDNLELDQNFFPALSRWALTHSESSLDRVLDSITLASPEESRREALDWLLEALVQDGDELIVCCWVDEDVLEKDHNVVGDEARELMRLIQEECRVRSGSQALLDLEYIPGRITDTLDRLIALYRPDSVVIGTRGKRSVPSGLAMNMNMGSAIGSVSKYCLMHSPVPIIVVRPERTVRKAVEKRRADPKRGTHFES
ncbi:hypothetical protein FPV67DRAFT_1678190 [Lyophyllum atratum]|nr:hypothetical protein FPV67DRAFT_1678190 [Lyophyllum atratum]